eukprot:9545965-Heterocapsa_arctica.AAC.1
MRVPMARSGTRSRQMGPYPTRTLRAASSPATSVSTSARARTRHEFPSECSCRSSATRRPR